MTIKNSENTYFYIHDHLGSTSMVLDVDGNISQSVTYIPYGEIFVEERNGTWNSPYLFNSKELDEETRLYYYGARYLNPTNCMWLSVDPLFEKYVGMSPYNYCAGNPVKLVDVDGREFDEVNEQIAQKIEFQLEVKIAELQSKRKQSSDEKERLNELQQSKFDIQSMRLKQGIKFQYKSSGDSDNPANGGPTIEGLGTSLVTMYVDDDMGSVLHESRHGGDVARGDLKYENYGVSHEVSAYKAQYAWDGILKFIDNPDQDVMIKRMYNNQPLNQCLIYNYNFIDSNMIKNIHYVENGIPKPLYPPPGIDKETFYNR